MNFIISILLIFIVISETSNNSVKKNSQQENRIYTASSQAYYTNEPYVGTVTIEISNQKITKVEFQIMDTLKNEVFGSDYDKHFSDNVLYQEQCHNDWKGVQLYPAKLIEKQNIDSVDAISGATWSYNIFNAAVKRALNK